jgi:hypothetical protein
MNKGCKKHPEKVNLTVSSLEKLTLNTKYVTNMLIWNHIDCMLPNRGSTLK